MINNKRILLINPSFLNLYQKTRFHRQAILSSPSLTLAVLAAPLLEAGFEVEILDLNLIRNFADNYLLDLLARFPPGLVGITFTTPLFNQVQRIARLIKQFNKDIVLIAGGPHVSALPEETLKDSVLDIAVQGEGDYILADLASGRMKDKLANIFYRRGGEIIENLKSGFICDLDKLPFPAWQLYDLNKIKVCDLLARKNPVGTMETSRGCPFGCVFCSKSVFGRTFRAKSPERVVAEMEYMLKLGFKEIHIIDDGFSTDIERAEKICELILRRKLNFPWSPMGGLRVDKAPRQLLQLMKQAGCYRVYYGIESGSQKILDNVCKGITLEQIRQAVKDAKEAGLEVMGFFMLGLPQEKEQDLQASINFAKELDLDMAKATIATPLPGTPLFEQWGKEGFILSRDWSDLNLYAPSKRLFRHPTLGWNLLEKYLMKFYKSFYFRPRFILKRFLYSIKKGRLLSDMLHFFRTRW